MSKFGGLLGRKPSLVAEQPAAPVEQDNGQRGGRDESLFELDQDLFLPSATQLGEENEAVRSLLADAECRINELDAVKDAIGKLVDPVSKTLRAFEEAKAERLGLQTILNSTRIAYGKLRNELTAVEKKAAVYESECARLQDDLIMARQYVGALEAAKAEQAADMMVRCAEITDLQRRAQQDAAELQSTREENRRFSERMVAADKRMVQLEAEIDTARQKLTLAERERAVVQAALDENLDESGRISRRLVELENALTATHARLRQMEGNLAEADAERTRLAATLNESNERHQNETNTQRMRFEALQSRAAVIDKLLDEARQALIARAEEIRAFDRRLVDATLARNAVEGKLGQIEGALDERESQLRDVEHARATLAERNELLTKAVTTRENAYNRAQEKIATLEDRIVMLEAELKGSRETAELQIEELNAKLQREKLERTMAEGALEAGRKDVARLLRELAGQSNRSAVNAVDALEGALRFHNAA